MSKGNLVANTLTVVMVDSHRARIAIVHENSFMPYRKRTIHIKLTEEQMEQLRPLWVGTEGGEDVYEELGEVWLEKDEDGM